jgi:hypothetical protein
MASLEPLDDAALRAQLARRAAGADSVDDASLRAIIATRVAGQTQRRPWFTPRAGRRPVLALTAGLLAVAFVVAAVVVRLAPVIPPVAQTPGPTAVAHSPSPGLTPVPTPVATLPSGPLDTTASASLNGVQVTIEFERNPMPAGEPTWVTTTVTNTGADDLIWLHGPCTHPTTVTVGGTVDGQTWRGGGDQTGASLRFRSMALAQAGVADGVIVVSFVPEAFVGKKGTYGCGDMGSESSLAPGKSIKQRARWDGEAGTLLGPPPTGRVELVGSFRDFWRRSAGEPTDESAAPAINVPLTAWIDGRVEGIIHPAEAIDAALLDRRLVAILETRDLGNANSPVIRYDPAAAVWQVGLLDDNNGGDPQVHLVIVDGHTGQILQFVERTWNFNVDGFP